MFSISAAFPLGRFLWTVAAGAAIVLVVMGSYIVGPSAAGTLYTATAAATAANTVTETTLIGSGTGSLTLAGGFFTAGKSVRLVAGGVYSSDASPPTLNIQVKFGSTVIGQTGAQTVAASQTNSFWRVDILITCRTTGATGTVIGESTFEQSISTGGVLSPGSFPIINTSTVTIDTTADQVVNLTATWGAAEAAATITGHVFAMAGYDAGTGGGGGGTIPPQSGNGGKFLQTDGSSLAWTFSTLSGTVAARPAAATANSGQLYLPTDGVYDLYRSTGSAWQPWIGSLAATEPVDGDFAWINQGTASVSTTSGGIIMSVPASASDNLRIRKKAAPATPYTIEAALLINWYPAQFAAGGIGFRQSSDGKIAQIVLTPNDGINTGVDLQVAKLNSPTSFNLAYVDLVYRPAPVTLVCFQISDNGTNRISRYSMDCKNYIDVHSVGRTDFLTADEVWWGGNSVNSQPMFVTLLHWRQF